MFEKIKLKIIKGRQLKPFAVAKVLQDHEDRLAALETPAESNDNQGGEQSGDNQGQQNNDNQGGEQHQEVTPTTRDLSFTINDGTDPIEGATVTIGEKTGTTGSAGGCTVTGVAEGSDITVEVSKEGYTTKTETITVDETHTSFTISLVAASSP